MSDISGITSTMKIKATKRLATSKETFLVKGNTIFPGRGNSHTQREKGRANTCSGQQLCSNTCTKEYRNC